MIFYISTILLFSSAQGACTESDVSIWRENQVFSDNVAKFALRNLGQAKGTVAKLMQEYNALSLSCAQCFGATVACGTSKCWRHCWRGPTSEACVECSETNCRADFIACSGLTDEIDWALPPTGVKRTVIATTVAEPEEVASTVAEPEEVPTTVAEPVKRKRLVYRLDIGPRDISNPVFPDFGEDDDADDDTESSTGDESGSDSDESHFEEEIGLEDDSLTLIEEDIDSDYDDFSHDINGMHFGIEDDMEEENDIEGGSPIHEEFGSQTGSNFAAIGRIDHGDHPAGRLLEASELSDWVLWDEEENFVDDFYMVDNQV